MTEPPIHTDEPPTGEGALYGPRASKLEVLLRGRAEPITVRPLDQLGMAIELMLQHGFGQLPVLDDHRRPVGLLTQQDVMRAIMHFETLPPGLRVRDVMRDVQAFPTKPAHTEIWTVLDDFETSPALCVVDADGRLVGLVTQADTIAWLRQRSADMAAVQDVEDTLKDLIVDAYARDPGSDLDAEVARMLGEMWGEGQGALVRRAIGRYVEGRFDAARCNAVLEDLAVEARATEAGFDRLTFAHYQRLLLGGAAWARYAPHISLTKGEFAKRLKAINEARNAVAHLRGLDRKARDHLLWFKKWLERCLVPLLDENGADEESLPPTEQAPEGIDDATPDAALGEDAGPIEAPEEDADDESASLAGLTEWLRRRRRRPGERVTLTFDELERHLGEPLPPEAREHRSWWSNSGPRAEAWLTAGYSVAGFFVNDQKVRFNKDRARERKYLEFFQDVAQRVHALHGWSFEPKAYSWLQFERVEAKCGKRFSLLAAFTRDGRFRLHAEIDVGDGARNAEILAGLQAHRDEMEARLGAPLDWRPAEGKRVCQVSLYAPDAHHIEDAAAALQKLAQWAAEQMGPFTQIMREFVAGA